MTPDDPTQNANLAYSVETVQDYELALQDPSNAPTQLYPRPDILGEHRDHATWILTSVLLLVVGGLVALIYHISTHTTIVSGPSTIRVQPQPTSTVTVTPDFPTVPSPTPVPTVPEPTPRAADPDTAFIEKLAHTKNPYSGKYIVVTDAAKAITVAQRECVWLADHPGAGIADVAAELHKEFPGMPDGDPEEFTKVAVSVYCPTTA